MYNTIVIVGVGLIGGSFGLAVRRKYPNTRIIGISSRAAITSALEMGAITEGFGYEELDAAVADADLIILCTPIHRIQGLLTVLAGIVREGVLITDVGSTKKVITDHAAQVLPKNVDFIGGHPMTGSERRGVDAAEPFLFQNAIYVITPSDGIQDKTIKEFSNFIGDLGASVIIMEAGIHDRIAATVSHLPQMLAVALVEMVGKFDSDKEPFLRLAAGGFRDMTRIASSPFTMWDDICRTNDNDIKQAIDFFIERLEQLKMRIGTPSLSEDFEVANITRATIPKDTKGFMRPLFEVLVVVEDRPGVIAEIASELLKSDINIKDIEVVKVREGEGGTLRLAFEGETTAQQAIKHLTGIGFVARMRK
ncbi:MAG: prephenate dehydrogenase [Candidatus Latescibacteria bacterium]|nr:prephenate dehydrogenase [Candidatus Latescibacterota bacterium]